MIRMSVAAFIAATMLGACARPDITSRMDTRNTLFSGFEDVDSYTPTPIGTRSENDFLRFSTMGVTY